MKEIRTGFDIVINMQDEDEDEDEEQICRKALAWMLSETRKMYREIVKSIEGGSDHFREQREKVFGHVVDASSFTDDEIIDKCFEINKLTSSGVSREARIREMARVLRIDSRTLHWLPGKFWAKADYESAGQF